MDDDVRLPGYRRERIAEASEQEGIDIPDALIDIPDALIAQLKGS